MSPSDSPKSEAFAALRKRILPGLAYLGYGLVLILVFLYLTFPLDRVEARLISQLEKSLSSRIQVAESQRLYPLGLVWQGVSLVSKKADFTRLDLEEVKVKVRLLPLLSRRLEIDFIIEAYDGSVQGVLFAEKQDGEILYRLQESASHVNLEAIGEALSVALKGHLKMEMEASWKGQNVWGAVGVAQVEFSDVRLEVGSIRGLEIPDLSFMQVRAAWNMKNGLLTLERFQAQGPLVDVTVHGTLLLRRRGSDGILNLSADLGVKDALIRKFPLAELASNNKNPVKVLIKGTLRRPLFSVNGMSLNL